MPDSASERVPVQPQCSYTCPGELYSIPRSIHLARLAAYYPKCLDCQYRFDTGHIFPTVEKNRRQTDRRVARESFVTDESVRGIYLNELDRNRAILWGEALAAFLWNEQPMVARPPDDKSQIVAESATETTESALHGPSVIVGFDERPSSPEIVSGVVSGLRRMGCPVIDLGQTTLPILAFNTMEFDASAGLFVTGAGCDPSSTGFEFLSHGANPFPHEALLGIEQSVKSGVGRQSRQIGGYQPCQGQARYETSLARHFHALRPLRMIYGSSTRLLPRILDWLFASLPCEATHVALPTRRRDLFDAHDVDLQRVATSVVEGRHHLGVVIDDDCRHLAFVTDRGRLVTPKEVARLVIEVAQREQHDAQFVVATSFLADAQRWLSGRDATVADGGESATSLVSKLVERDAVLAISGDGRIWFRHAYPACDAVLVLAQVLQVLSLSDAPFSEVITRINADVETM